MNTIRPTVPIRDLNREGTRPGPVKTWFLTPEELEAYRAKHGYNPPRGRNGEKLKQPIKPADKVRNPRSLKTKS